MYSTKEQAFYKLVRAHIPLFIAIHENHPSGVCYIPLKLRETAWVNPDFIQLLGYTPAEAPDFTLETLLHPLDCQYLLETAAASTDPDSLVLNLRIRHRQGHDVQGKWLVFVTGEARDHLLLIRQTVSYNECNMASLQYKSRLLQAFINLSNELCCITDLKGNVLFLNQVWEKALGYPFQSLQSFQLSQFIHPHDLEASRNALKKLMEGLQVVNYRNRLQASDGSFKHFKWHAKAQNGFVYAAAEDITPEVLVTEQLAEKEELVKSITDNLPGIIFRQVSRPDGSWHMDFVSRGVEGVLGITKADLLSHPELFEKNILPEDLPLYRQCMANALELHQPFEHTWRALNTNGNILWLSGYFIPKALPNGQVQCDAMISDITQRKTTEEALFFNEKKFRFLTEATSEMICQHQPDGTYEYLSPSVEKLLGYQPHELEGKSPYINFHPEDLERIRTQSHQRVLEGQPVTSIEYRIRRKDGQYIWFDTHTDPVLGANGEVVSLITRTRDITAKKKGEEQLGRIMQQLNEEKRRLESIIAQIPAGFILAEAPSGKIIRFNKQAERILGHPLVLFTTLASYERLGSFTPEGQPLSAEEYPISKVIATQHKVENKEYQYKKGDGQFVTLLSNAAPLFDEDQNLTAVVNIFTDISFIKEAERALMDKNKALIEIEQELRASEEELTTYIMELNRSKEDLEAQREALKLSEASATALARQYQSILDSQAVYVLKTDAKGSYTYVNGYFRNRFGYKGYLIGQSALESVIEEDRYTCSQTVERCFRQPGIPHEVILRKPDKHGNIKGGKWEFKGVPDENGQVHEVLCVGFDITEQLENIEQARYLLDMTQRQNERLIEYTNITSHNLRAPVARLLGLCDLLEMSPENPEYIPLIRQSAKKLDETIRLMNDLLDIEQEGSKLRKKEVNLYQAVQQSFEQLIAHGHSDGELILDMPSDQMVYVVPAYLDSIVYNLLSNAIKYRKNHEPAKVTVRCPPHNDFLVMEVTDQGIGIDLEKYGSKLFKMKSRLNTNMEGKGIGLFFTKQQLEAMGGKIEVYSQPGMGTTFKAYFPRVAQYAASS